MRIDDRTPNRKMKVGDKFEIIIDNFFVITSIFVECVKKKDIKYLKCYNFRVDKIKEMTSNFDYFIDLGQLLFQIDDFSKFHILTDMYWNITIKNNDDGDVLYKISDCNCM